MNEKVKFPVEANQFIHFCCQDVVLCTYTFFDQKFKNFKAFQGHINFFPFFKDSRGAKSSQHNATSDAQSREKADFHLKTLEKLRWIKLATNFTDFPAPTAIFKDF